MADKPPPLVAVGEFVRPTGDDGWAALRAEDLLGVHLTRLGVAVRRRPFAAAPRNLERDGLEAALTGRLVPAMVKRDMDAIAIQVDVRGIAGSKRFEQKGVARDLDSLVARLAIDVAKFVGVEVPSGADTLLADVGHVFGVQRFLGRAELRLERRADRQAAVMFDRARTFRKRVFVPEAIGGRRRAEGALLAAGDSSQASRTTLAASAAERAEVDARSGRYREAERGWNSFLRYTDRRALRWTIALPLSQRPVIVGKRSRWQVQDPPGRGSRFVFDPRTGTILEVAPAIRGLVAATDEHFITMRAGRLARLDERLRTRWDVKLPMRPAVDLGASAVELTSGLIGVKGDSAVVWLEVSFGKVGQLALEVVPLASSPGGVVVLARPKGQQKELDVALLRPGKRTPAWRTPVDDPSDALMTRDIVVLTTPAGLQLLRTYNGKRVKAPLPLDPGARLLGAYGRHGCVGYDDKRVAIVDIVAGEQTALVQGPGKGVACDTTADGVAVLFATGDLIFYDRDGRLLDRARVDGEPLGIQRGHPERPGPIVITSHGLFSFGEIPIDSSRLRDVDGMVALAKILRINDNDAAALVVVTQVALMSAGRVKEAETIRAELLEKKNTPAATAAAAWARKRAAAAADPKRPLPRFRIQG